MKITIKDIALKTNFSTKTISRVINDDPMVSPETRSKIKKTIGELGYRPNIIARSLRQSKTNIIGFIVPDILNPAFPMLFKGATEVLDKNGYYAFLSCSDNNPEKELEFIKDYNSMLISGVIVIPIGNEDKNSGIFSEFLSPMVILDREIDGINKDIVLISNKVGSYDAIKYLIGMGHKKIVILCGPLDIKTAFNRLKGWEMAMNENNLYYENLKFYGDFSISSGYEAMKRALNSVKGIDAVFASNDIIAMGAIKAMEESGLRIPEDISIVGFDDVYISQFLKPSLTTVSHPLYDEGRRAAEILLERINGNIDSEPQRVVLKTNFIIRESVASKTAVIVR